MQSFPLFIKECFSFCISTRHGKAHEAAYDHIWENDRENSYAH